MSFLKQNKFDLAAAEFREAIDEVVISLEPDLNGSLPALYNYLGLSLAKSGLAHQEQKANLELGLEAFERAATLYEKFSQKGFDLSNSHDYQSHLFHRGMILCESVEKYGQANFSEFKNKLLHAEKLLLISLAGREKNKADEQRIGDVCEWLGRIYVGLKETEKAAQYFLLAHPQFQNLFMRFDVVAIDDKEINWIQGAFY